MTNSVNLIMVHTKELSSYKLLLERVCTGWEGVGGVRGYGWNGVTLEGGCEFEEGNIGDIKSNHRSIPHSTRIAQASTYLGMTIALPESLSAKVVWRKDIGKPSVIPARETNPLLQWTAIKKNTWSAWKEVEEGSPHRSPH